MSTKPIKADEGERDHLREILNRVYNWSVGVDDAADAILSAGYSRRAEPTVDARDLLKLISHADVCPFNHDGPCECEATHDARRILAAGYSRRTEPTHGSRA